MFIGSPILLERPIRAATLVSSVRAALRARKRQYEIRDTLRDRAKALAELKQERETLQAVLDNVPVGILLVESAGKVILGNRSVERILRCPLAKSPRALRMIDGSLFILTGVAWQMRSIRYRGRCARPTDRRQKICYIRGAMARSHGSAFLPRQF